MRGRPIKPSAVTSRTMKLQRSQQARVASESPTVARAVLRDRRLRVGLTKRLSLARVRLKAGVKVLDLPVLGVRLISLRFSAAVAGSWHQALSVLIKQGLRGARPTQRLAQEALGFRGVPRERRAEVGGVAGLGCVAPPARSATLNLHLGRLPARWLNAACGRTIAAVSEPQGRSVASAFEAVVWSSATSRLAGNSSRTRSLTPQLRDQRTAHGMFRPSMWRPRTRPPARRRHLAPSSITEPAEGRSEARHPRRRQLSPRVRVSMGWAAPEVAAGCGRSGLVGLSSLAMPPDRSTP